MHGTAPVHKIQTGTAARPRVVVVGAGFGGLAATRSLESEPVEVTLVDRHNYHLFQPLLYQVATAGLSPNQIATPIRQILSRQKNASVLMSEVVDIDLDRQAVITGVGSLPFDYLIVATGARHAYFGHEDWERFAPGIKQIDEATRVRRRLLLCFERAEMTRDPEESRRLLTFVVIGGGPTGVELAGAIAELARKSLVRDFRNIDPSTARIVLVEAGPRILPSFPEALSNRAARQLENLGVDIVTGDAVTDCGKAHVMLKSGRRMASGMIVWSAGVMASPAAKWLKSAADRSGRVPVGADLRLPGHDNVFVVGDTAAVADARGRAVPGVAPAAKQMGRHAARAIAQALRGGSIAPFVYRDYGNLATIGRKAAVADFGRIRLSGLAAWFIWGLVHVGFLIGFRNRFTVMLDWAWSYFTFSRGARLITGERR